MTFPVGVLSPFLSYFSITDIFESLDLVKEGLGSYDHSFSSSNVDADHLGLERLLQMIRALPRTDLQDVNVDPIVQASVKNIASRLEQVVTGYSTWPQDSSSSRGNKLAKLAFECRFILCFQTHKSFWYKGNWQNDRLKPSSSSSFDVFHTAFMYATFTALATSFSWEARSTSRLRGVMIIC